MKPPGLFFRYHLLLVPLLLLGFALRVHQLGDQNVWWDEAYSAVLAREALPDLLRITAHDVHPPLYYLLLKGWGSVAGDSEFALRYPGVLIGVLTLALGIALARRLFCSPWAWGAGLLLALSRFHIWWAQEARMYILAAGLALLLFYLLLRRRWGAYALASAAGLYSLYLFGLTIPALAAALLMLVWRAGWPGRDLGRWALAQGAALLLYLPWLLYALPRIRSDSVDVEIIPQNISALYLLLLAAGISTEVMDHLPLILAYGAVALLSLGLMLAQRRWELLALFLPAFLSSPLVIYQFSWLRWRFYTPEPEARYFLLFAGLSVLLPAAGAMLLARWRRWAGLLLFMGVLGMSLWGTLGGRPDYYAGRHLRDQWKSAAGFLHHYAQPSDLILLVSADRYPLLAYELGRFPALPPFRGVPAGAELSLNPGNLEAQMQAAVGAAPRVWLVEMEAGIQDPQGLARAWFAEGWQPIFEVPYGYNRLTLFSRDGAAPHLQAPPSLLLPLPRYRPGDQLTLGLPIEAWQQEARLRLRHESGLAFVQALLHNPHPAAPYLAPYTLHIPQAMPAGRYTVEVAGETLGSFRVQGSDPAYAAADLPPFEAQLFGGVLELLSSELSPAMPDAGDTLHVDLYWRRNGPAAQNYTIFVQVVGGPNPATATPIWGQHDGPPVQDSYPLPAWAEGLIVRDRHSFTLDAAAPAGEYWLLVGAYDPQSGERLPLAASGEDALLLQTLTLP